MPIIRYAVEIETGTALSNATYGIVGGYFRFVTDRPTYDGATTIPTGDNSGDVWYNGFFTKGGIGKTSRSVNIDNIGTYGTLSSFSFSLSNYNALSDYVESNDIYLTGKAVRFYVVVDDVFYQQWNGIVRNNPRGESDFSFQCVDNFRTLHDLTKLPPEQITKTNFPDVPVEVDGESIPVCVGDVPFARLQNVNAEVEVVWDNINAIYYSISYGFLTLLILDTISNIDPEIGVPEEAKDVADLYLQVKSGESTDLIKINNYGIIFHDTQFRVYYEIDTPLSVDPVEFNTANVSRPLTKNTWWFKAVKIAYRGVVSTKEIVGYVDDSENDRTSLSTFVTDQNTYLNINRVLKEAVADSSDPATKYPHLKYVAKSATEEFDLSYYTPIDFNVVEISYALYTYVSGSASDLNDYDRTTGVALQRGSVDGNEVYLSAVTAGIPSGLLSYDFEKVYVCFDLTDTSDYGAGRRIQYRLDFNVTAPRGDTINYQSVFPTSTDENGYQEDINFLPQEYYSSQSVYDTNDEYSYFPQYFTGIGESGEVRAYFELDQGAVSKLKSGIYSGIKDIRITVVDNNAPASGNTFDINLKFKQIGMVGMSYANVQNNGMYTKVSGEEYSAGVETNNVYNAFRHILENYNGLSSSDIDYGNLPTERLRWHCGKQLLKRGSSFDELKKLCAQSMVCIVPTRDGKRKLSAFIDDTSAGYTHDESTIVKESIKGFKTDPIVSLYNNFEIKYNWDAGRGKYTKSFIVSNVHESAFPAVDAVDSNGNLLWPQYVAGLNDTSYSSAKIMWETCNDAYLRSSTTYAPPSQLQELDWFIDTDQFDGSGAYVGTDSSAWKYLSQLADWTSRPKAEASYSLPITSDTLVYELLDNVEFTDVLYTDGNSRTSKIVKLSLDPKKDIVNITIKMNPFDLYDSNLIIERGNVGDDTITERGNVGDDTITEVGA